MNLRTYANEWLNSLDKRVSTRTLWCYRKDLRLSLETFGSLELQSVRRKHVQEIIGKSLSLAPETVRGRVRTLRCLFGSAVEQELIESNPAQGLRLHLPPSKTRPAFSQADLRSVLLVADELLSFHCASVFWLMAYSGLRIGEALALQRSHVDLTQRTLRVSHSLDLDYPDGLGPTKNRRERVVQIGAMIATRLARLISSCESRWLFARPIGDRLHEREARRGWVRIRAKLSLPPQYVPHCLRHTYASLLIADGAPIVFVQRQLGHRKISTTIDRYGCHSPIYADKHLLALDNVVVSVTDSRGDKGKQTNVIEDQRC